MTVPERLLGGRYQVGELLGYGGMAEVHRGRDNRLGRDVAIKMLRTDLARDNTFQMRFRREAQNAASLNHPAIVAVYDTGEELAATGEPLPYIIMEFVNGRTLKEVLAAEQRLQPRRALEITADICAALEFSHRHGIIHRDIKPGNVMLTPNGQVKVMDFGIARALASGATTMTQTSAVIGTAQYLSPEQARGEAVDARSDVYAAGCVLFELLIGHPPFIGDSAVSVAYQHVREDPRAPSEIDPEVPPDIDAVVLKALAKNPVNRYQSAAEMRADLLRAAAGRPVLATPVMRGDDVTMPVGGVVRPGTEARVGDPDRRRASNWVLVALGVLGVLAVTALIIGLILNNRTQEQPVAVPGVLGLIPEDAEAAITAAHLVPAQGDQLFSTDCEEGQVAAQVPEADDQVAVGDTVTYQVCGGPVVVVMPDLENFPEQRAIDELESLKLAVEVERVNSGDTQGLVLGTEPPAGKKLHEGDTVTIRVSKGNLVEVPSVVGQTETQATATLQANGFEVDPRKADSKPEEPGQIGTIAAQNPEGGQAERGSTVVIFVYPDGEDLVVGDPVVAGDTVTLEWNNDIYGNVEITWGDGQGEPGDPAGQASHQYLVSGEYDITVQSVEHPFRTGTVTVTIEEQPNPETP